MLTRRTALLGVVATVTASLLPMSASAVTDVAAKMPAWAVGTWGEWNWQPIFAKDAEAAILAYVQEHTGEIQCAGDGPAECDCEFCSCLRSLDTQRQPEWDGLEEVNPIAWFKAGMGTHCDRCSYETSQDECGHIVGSEVVCEGCLTLTDWRIVDPEHAAELDKKHADRLALASAKEKRGE